MKKTLVFLALCLVLCLACAWALAADDHELAGISFENPANVTMIAGHHVDPSTAVCVQLPDCWTPAMWRYACTEPAHIGYFHEAYFVNGPENYRDQWGRIDYGHLWSSDVVQKTWGMVEVQATCTSTGIAKDYCVRCGRTREEIDGKNHDRIIEKIGHQWQEILDIFPDCKTPGYVYFQCKVCGEIKMDGLNTVWKMVQAKDLTADARKAIAASFGPQYTMDENGHIWDELVVDPARPLDGCAKIQWCIVCGVKREISPAPVYNDGNEYVDADGKKYRTNDLPDFVDLLDCFTQKKTYLCVNCGGQHPGHVKTITEAVKAHVYSHAPGTLVSETKPTCTESGVRIWRCAIDPTHEYETEYVAPLGHDWSDWQLRQVSGDYSYWLRACDRCGMHDERITEGNAEPKEFEDVIDDGLNYVDGHWYFYSQNEIVWWKSGFVLYNGNWFYLRNGELDTSANGLYDYDGGRFAFAAGKLRTDINGLWLDPKSNCFYYLANGQVQTQYTGVVQYDGAFFYVVDGKLASNMNSPVEYDGATFTVVNGQLY